MKKKIYDLFPLTVLKEKINLSAAEKEKLVKFIFQSEKKSKQRKHMTKNCNLLCSNGIPWS